MHILVFSILRSKVKLLLSILIFIIILALMMIVINSYDINSKKIAELKKTEMHTVINVSVSNQDDIEKIIKILHINNIDKKELSSNLYSVVITVDEEKNVNYVEKEISVLGYENSKNSIISPELEMYLEIDNFNKIFISVIIICLVILLFIELKLQFVWENKNIIFLKILGYKNSLILTIIFFRILIQIFIADIFSIIIFLVFYIINHYTYNINAILLPTIFCICAITIFLPLFFSKIKKINFS